MLEDTLKALVRDVAEQIKPAAAPAKPKLLDLTKAAAYLGISRRAIEYRVAQKQIPTVRLGGRVYIPVAELDRMIESATEIPA